MAAYFITEQYLKDTSIIDENVDSKYLTVGILEAQDMHIHPVLGTKFYNSLQAEIEASSVTSANDTLITDFIAPALKYWSLNEMIDSLVFKFRNKSISTASSDNSQPITDREVVRLKGLMKDKAQWYTQRLINHLCENATTYPDYDNPDSGVDQIQPNRDSAYTHGMWLGGTKGKRKGGGLDTFGEPYLNK